MIAALRVVDPNANGQVLEEVGITVQGHRVRRKVEDELIIANLELTRQQGADPSVGIGDQLADQLWAAILLEPEEGDRQPGGRNAELEVQHVGRDGGTGIGHCYPPRMPNLTIRVGALNFTAGWEAEAPRNCRWSGEGTWIPLGDLRTGVGYEHHTSHPAPGELLIYTGDLSECEILFPYGACAFSSKLGQLAGNHFATLEPDQGWRDRLREVGRRVLWEGAQEIEIGEG